MAVTATDVEQSMICIPWLMSWLQSMKMLRRFALTDLCSFETESTYGIAFRRMLRGMMYNVQIGPKSDDIQPIAETLSFL